MFVFDRSVWTVAAGVGTALAVLGFNLLLERASATPAATSVAVVHTSAEPVSSFRQAGDISLARR